jgi:tetratricopeptide (TPR) repeat protein
MNIDEKFQSAFQHHKDGDLQRAKNIYREILEVHPDNSPALHLLGVVFYQLGDYDTAIGYIRKSLRLNQNNPAAHNHLGSALKAKGHLKEAIRHHEKAIELNPAFAEAYYNLGNTLIADGQLDEAIACYKKVISLRPGFIQAYCNLGKAFYDAGRCDDAALIYREALDLSPYSADIHDALGIALQEKGDAEEAIACFKKAIALNPDSADAYGSLAKILQEKGLSDEALMYYKTALQLNADEHVLSNLHNNIGLIYQEKGQFHEAINSFRKALQYVSSSAGIFKNLGTVYHDLGLFDDAIVYCNKAIELDPGDAETYCNLGSVLQDKGKPDEALKYYQKALQLNPSFAEAHWNISLTQLISGNFKEGWKNYEWRLRKQDTRPILFQQPVWDGSPLKEKRIIVTAEQGVGDEIMFASCLPELIDRAGLCIVECDNRLVPLFARSFPKARLIPRINTIDNYPPDHLSADVRIALGSLPKFFRSDLLRFSQHGAYLEPDHQQVVLWRERYADLGAGMKVGISWRGGSKPSVRLARSTSLADWTKVLSVAGVHFINLQYGDCALDLKEAEEKTGVTIHDWEDADPLKDLDNFAAMISPLDLIISVDNSTVHMSGALGVPVWTLLPHACDWRWMSEFEDTPWYKTVRLFRQREQGEWEGVFTLVRAYLQRYLSTGIMPGITCSYNSLMNHTKRLQNPS